MSRKPRKYLALAVCSVLLLAVGLVFGQTVRHEFVNFDDDRYVYDNPQVFHGLTAEGSAWAFTHSHGFTWHPITWLSLMLDGQVYGLNAGGYHLTNVLLHAATAILLFLVLWRMTDGFWASALVAALFAVHPLRAESVAWVSERKDILSGLFFTLTLGAYVGYVRRRFAPVRYLAVMVFFALGLMSKPMLVTLPFVLLLLDYWPLGRMDIAAMKGKRSQDNRHPERSEGSRNELRPRRSFAALRMTSSLPGCERLPTKDAPIFDNRRQNRFSLFLRLVFEKVPLLLLVVVSCVLTIWSQGKALVPIERLPLWWRIGNALTSYVVYLGQLFYPLSLAVLYPRPGLDLPLWKILGSFLVLAAITAAAFFGRRRYPYLLVGWLWYLGMLAPVIGLVQVGAGAAADRFTYLPQIGLCLALVWAAADACRSWPYHRWVCGVASVLVLAVLMGCAWRQTSFWRDGETLWTHALACTSRNAVAHNNVAYALQQRGKIDEAAAHCRQALEINPDYAEAHNNLGAALADLGRSDEAIPHYRKAVDLKPDYAGAHANLGIALARGGRFDEAMAQYRKALEIDPGDAKVHCNLGVLLADRGRFDEALAHYRHALEINPGVAEPHNNLAWLLATCPAVALRNGAEAIAHAQRANQLCGGKRADLLDTLAAAYAEAGRFSEALATARQALESATQQPGQPLADELRSRIRLYQAGKPYRQTLSAPAPAALLPPRP